MPRSKQPTPSQTRQGLPATASTSFVPIRKAVVQRSTPRSSRPQLARKRVVAPQVARRRVEEPPGSRERSSTVVSDHGSASLQRDSQRRRRRRTAGVLVMREIRRLQLFEGPLIPRAPFYRLIREITAKLGKEVRFQAAALQAIQEASEFLLVSLFEDVNLAATHGRRVTVMPRDITLVTKLRRASGRR